MKLLVTHAPHIKSKNSIKMLMEATMLSLIPATIYGIYLFGANALALVITSIVSCMFFEFISCKVRKLPLHNLGPAALTGLFVALVVSSATAWWMMIVGAFIAIVVAKHMFGGLGFNIFNPALVARAFLAASWPVAMTKWFKPFDAVTSATPLGFVKSQGTEVAMSIANNPNLSAFAADPRMLLTKMGEHVNVYWQLFFGNVGGCIGETSALLLLLGVIYLFLKDVIDWRIPTAYIGTVAVTAIAFGSDPIFHILAGGVILGAFFMATDLVTSPVGKRGRWLFGLGCGFITMMIRFFGGYPEGVCYAILIMNAFVPLIDRYIPERIYGHKA
ncbi:RnfABCDGE type electron transport complex subunit D [Candidatus Margulisiibacteriota bacterium]